VRRARRCREDDDCSQDYFCRDTVNGWVLGGLRTLDTKADMIPRRTPASWRARLFCACAGIAYGLRATMTDVLRRMQTVQFPLRTFRSSNRCENAGASAGDQLWMDFQAELPEHVVGAELVALATAFELRPPSVEKARVVGSARRLATVPSGAGATDCMRLPMVRRICLASCISAKGT
jgi:hypothetical protein